MNAIRPSSRIILAQLVRIMAYSSAGSALWALLPGESATMQHDIAER